jgi:hypothetical protein
MTSPSSNVPRRKSTDIGDYGFARVRDLAFDAVMTLWRRRSAEGWKKSDLATKLNRDRGWVSTNLRGPGNWTLRTFGELVNALDGEAEIRVFALEDPLSPRPNFDAYLGYGESPINPLNPRAQNQDGSRFNFFPLQNINPKPANS